MTTLVAGACIDADDVREIIDTDLVDTQINFFINMAYYATLRLVGKLDKCGGNGALCIIQRLLAAHFMSMHPDQRQLKSISIAGEYAASFMGKDGLMLDGSTYGQAAKAMDCSGTLPKYGLKGVSLHAFNYAEIDEDTTDG